MPLKTNALLKTRTRRLLGRLVLVLTALLIRWPALSAQETAPAAAAPDAAMTATAPAAAKTATAPPKAPFELQPYKVEVALVFEDSPELGPVFRKTVHDELNAAIDRSIGPMWDLSLTSGEWLTPHSSTCVQRMSVDAIKTRAQSLDADKIYPISIELVGSEFRLTGREWDHESQLLGVVKTRQTRNRKMVATEISRLLDELFRTVIAIDEGDPAVGARIRIRAGEFWPADPAFSQADPGRFYVPFMKSFAKDRSLRKVSFVPWCYLSAKEVNRSKVECSVDAGVRVKFGAKRRTEWRGLGIRPTLPSTELTVMAARTSAKPLIGYFVGVYDEQPKAAPKPAADALSAPTEAPPEPKMLSLRTDRFGRVTLPSNPEKPLHWVLVRSGRELLTQFPVIPGVEASMTAQCPDDTERLDVEGQMAMVETDLIDTIAKRAVTMSLIKSRAKKEEWPKVDQGFAELASLVKYPEFDRRVTEVQYAAIKKAQAKKNVTAEDRIKKLGSKVLEIAKFHLDEEKIDDLKTDMAELRKLTVDKVEIDETLRLTTPNR